MDWVQWYYVVMLAIATVSELAKHGEMKTGRYDFRVFFLALLLSIPTAGRIFGWW